MTSFGSQDLSVVVKATDGLEVLRDAAAQAADRRAQRRHRRHRATSRRRVPRISVKANAEAAGAGFTDQTLGATVAQGGAQLPAAKATLDDSRARRGSSQSARPAETICRA